MITSRRFDAPPRRWGPAASGTVVTVTVTSSDSGSGARRHVGLTEPEAWTRVVFAEFDRCSALSVRAEVPRGPGLP